MIKSIKILWYKVFPTYKMLEGKCCSYAEADYLIKYTRNLPEEEQWQIWTNREDHNYILGWVWICKKVRIVE